MRKLAPDAETLLDSEVRRMDGENVSRPLTAACNPLVGVDSDIRSNHKRRGRFV